MAVSSDHIKQFATWDLYFQWLRRRQAWPTRLDRVAMPWLWVLVFFVLAWIAFIFCCELNTFKRHGWFIDENDVITFIAGMASGALLFRWLNPRPLSPRWGSRSAFLWIVRILVLVIVWWALMWWVGGSAHISYLPSYLAGVALWGGVLALWMIRRRVWPSLLDQVRVPWLWRLSCMYLVWWAAMSLVVVTRNPEDITTGIAGGISIFIIVLYPVVTILFDFLLYVPKAIRDDVESTMMQAIFHAPVSTAEIFSGLRRWGMALNLKHLAPPIALVAGLSLVGIIAARPSQSDLGPLVEVLLQGILPVVALLVLIWWFLLGTGLAAAGLPRWATVSGAVFVWWIVPVLIGVFYGGSVLASDTWDMVRWERGGYGIYEWEFAWFVAHFLILLAVPTAVVWRLGPRFMEMRRQGRWS